jgi:chemotaxis protein methyltransferase CheR
MATEMEQFQRFNIFINQRFGISFEEISSTVLIKRVNERMKILKITDIDTYYNLITTNITELTKLIDTITNNLTFFFRSDFQLQSLTEFVLPEIVKKNSDTKKIKIWSAGCSTGEEPYSIAMLITKYLGSEASLWDIEIIASDISLRSILIAREGFYPKKKFENVDPYFIKHFTDEETNGYRIKKKIKKLVKLDFHNLMYENSYSQFDIVFCRNVIIYFDQASQLKLIETFYNKMKSGSYLFLGSSESLMGFKTDFISKKLGNAFIYYKS